VHMMKATSETLRFYNADPPRLVINNPVDILLQTTRQYLIVNMKG
jgi:hypothetical protein